MKVWMHLDERSAAFFALGMAKARRQPVAVVSTSGTAAVNFAPAVVEAYYARVPLVVLTADRPPELRDVGANQTIDQIRLYGSHVKWSADVPLPEASDEAIRYARVLACRAAATARDGQPGPVHLNFPFREPLVPTGDEEAAGARETRLPYVSISEAPRRWDPPELAPLAAELRSRPRGLMVCGPQDDPAFPAAALRLAEALGYPVLADPLSQVRCGPHHGRLVIDSYDAFLRDAELAQELAPDVVLRFGATPTSKPLLQYLERHARSRQVLVDGDGGWNDPALIASDLLRVDARSLCEELLAALPSPARSDGVDGRSDWLQRWVQAGQETRAALQERLAGEPGLSEPRVFAELAALLPERTIVFVGNSMPVRDLDTFFPGNGHSIRFLANRGASGIDGVVSAALGVSGVSEEPLVLVIGDLSFYHDMNGLLAAKRHNLSATIVLLNNDGGGIFSFLPQAGEPEHFEELFGTPHGLDFRQVAGLYGLGYRAIDGWETFRSAVRESTASSRVTLLEVRTDRGANVALHRDLWGAVSEALRAAARS
jgi:2-succinyl-5-enolpyruvyl-6-hydroxy-3-cyclohexene-1-carboxylate synthase